MILERDGFAESAGKGMENHGGDFFEFARESEDFFD